MVQPQEAPCVAVSVLYLLFAIAAVASKFRTGFRLYLLLGVSGALRGIGWALRATDVSDPGYDKGLEATSLVFRQAGFGISLAVQAILMGCWFKNADAEALPPRQMRWSVGVRLLIAPIITFGPIMGIAIAVLVYGEGDPSSMHSAMQLRYGSSWGMLGIVAIFLSALLLALTTVLRQRRRLAAKASAGSPPPVAADPNCWVLLLLGLASLEAVACTFRVVSNYQPQFSYNDNLLYPLQVLPELLYFSVLLLPGLMPRVGLAGRYSQWAPAAAQPAPKAEPSSAAPTAAGAAPAGAAEQFFAKPLSRAVFFMSFKQRSAAAAAGEASISKSSSKLDASVVAEGDEEAALPTGEQ